MFDDIIQNIRTSIETCRLIETRMVDNYVLAMRDGAVLHSDGIHDFYRTLDKVERTRDRAKIEGLLAQVREDNPDNSAVAGLTIMGWKKAARLQIAKLNDLLQMLEEKQKA